MKHKIVSVVGLGYVGLPLAEAFSKHLKVIGFDIDEEKTINLGNNNNTRANIEFTTDPSKIKLADFVIIAVPTPVTKSNPIKSKAPDLRYVKLFCFAKTSGGCSQYRFSHVRISIHSNNLNSKTHKTHELINSILHFLSKERTCAKKA